MTTHNNILEKLVWNETDFNEMSWHDSRVYAIAFGAKENEIMLDIDYILKWIPPVENEINFRFFIAPSTLVFRNVYDLNISLSSTETVIDSIYKNNPRIPKNHLYIKEGMEYDWIIETTNGQISFKSVGYNQYLRRKPILVNSQEIGVEERFGISFSTNYEERE